MDFLSLAFVPYRSGTLTSRNRKKPTAATIETKARSSHGGVTQAGEFVAQVFTRRVGMKTNEQEGGKGRALPPKPTKMTHARYGHVRRIKL